MKTAFEISARPGTSCLVGSTLAVLTSLKTNTEVLLSTKFNRD